MDVDSRRNESRGDLKRIDIQIEVSDLYSLSLNLTS